MPNVVKKPSWQLPERVATPENVYRDRRAFLKAAGVGALGMMGLPFVSACAQEAAEKKLLTHQRPLPEFEKNEAFRDAGRAVSSLEDEYNPFSFNNFYEFGMGKKDPAAFARNFDLDPYALEIDGLVEKPVKLDLDQIEKLGLEERIYRFRCVEAWAMTIPWVGVPLHKVLKQVAIKDEAKYLAIHSFYDPDQAPGQRSKAYTWPYFEGLRLDEAMNELTLVTTGMYGRRLPPQNGTPLRIIVPWKFGFKGPKSVVKITLVDKEPPTFWNESFPSEYKFYSNVDPQVPHPRWSQAREKLLADIVKEVPTQWYNGYGEYVAEMYKDMPRKLL